jgi:hypothetical protein
MTLLYALPAFYSRYNKASLITLLLQTENKGNNANNHAIKYFWYGIPPQIYLTLFRVIHFYYTIVIIHIIT